jgi:hypothetical protein
MVHRLGYRLDDLGIRVRFLEGARDFSFLHNVQTGSGAHPHCYSMVIGGFFFEGKAAEA